MKTKRLPRGFRKGHDGSLACPHRDISCCGECAKAHEEIVDVVGCHFWVPNPADRAQLLAECKSKSESDTPHDFQPSTAKGYDPNICGECGETEANGEHTAAVEIEVVSDLDYAVGAAVVQFEDLDEKDQIEAAVRVLASISGVDANLIKKSIAASTPPDVSALMKEAHRQLDQRTESSTLVRPLLDALERQVLR